ncbi:MAG: glycosyltransferase family 2 protein [Armatimonadota bacterium]
MIDVSVVIPTYNARDQIASALAVLDEHDGTFEVIVVDDGSTDGTAEMLEGARLSVPLRVLRERRRGRAIARNLGAAEARGRILLFIDADTRPTPGLVAAHARHYGNEDRLGVQGRTLQHPETLRTTFMRAMYLLPDLSPRSRSDLSITHVTARNFSVARRPFQEVGGFDEAFGGYGYEDTDLALRLRHVGVRFLYEPTSSVPMCSDVSLKRCAHGQSAMTYCQCAASATTI